MKCRVSAGTRVKRFKFHILGDKRMFRFKFENDCPFCMAAAKVINYSRTGQVAYICEGEDESHVHEVECVGFQENGCVVLTCNGVTAQAARQQILKHAVS